jgi:hypothetical protein
MVCTVSAKPAYGMRVAASEGEEFFSWKDDYMGYERT